MAKGSYFLVYFTGDADLDAAQGAFTPSTWLQTTRSQSTLTVQATPLQKDGRPRDLRPPFELGLSTEPHVRIEAEEVAETHGLPDIARCDRRFEVFFDDLDEVLDEYNTLFEVQTVLQRLTGGYVENAWNGTLFLALGKPCACPRCRFP